MDDINMINGFSHQALSSSLSKENFHLILYPTEQCNFRCVYCYEDFEIGQMPTWLVDATKLLIEKKAKTLKLLSLSWFGGEPLLAKDIVFDLAEHALQLAEKYHFKLGGDMTTNGLLLDVKTLSKLVSLKQDHFQISIDGDQQGHDQTRVTRTGKGSFDKIWARLIAAAETTLPFKITLRIHVTDFNQESVLQFCERFDQHLAQDDRFILFFKAIENLGGDNTESVKQLIERKTAKLFAKNQTEKYRENSFDLNKKGNYICYAGKPNSIAIRANGELNKCTVALSDPKNKIGQINQDGTLTIESKKMQTWLQGFTTLDSWQMGCPLSYMNSNSTIGDIQIKKVG
ncbi:radical SAM protein [Shewanella sp. 0m-8]